MAIFLIFLGISALYCLQFAFAAHYHMRNGTRIPRNFLDFLYLTFLPTALYAIKTGKNL